MWSDAYRFAMIKSFRNKGLEAFATTGDTRKLPVRGAAARKLARQLAVLNAAIKPEDMNLPGFYFHGLRGEQRYSVRVTANYRLTYGWNDKDAIDVDLEDYH
jgi:proteic killer suppression protein